MDMMGKEPMGGAPMMGGPMEEGMDAEPGTVTIKKQPDGSFMVNGKPAGDIESALTAAREILTGDDGGMSVEQAFGQGFKGDRVNGPGY